MASFQQLFYQARSPFESPAKIFAKLKSQMQREVAGNVFDDEYPATEFYDGLRSPKRRTEDWPMHEMFGNGEEVTALTLSPIPSPQKNIGSRPEREQLPCAIAYTPRQRPLMESTTVSNTPEPHMNVLYTRDKRAHGYVHCDPGVLQQAPESVFSPMKKRLRKRKLDEQLLSKACYMAPNTDYIHCPDKDKKLSRACSEDDHYMNMREVDPVALKHTVQSHTKGVEETLPRYPVTPAKIFAFLKEKENHRDLSNVQKVQSSPRPDADWSKPRDPTFNHFRCNNLPIVDNQSEVREEPNCAMSIMDTLQSPDLDQEAPLPHDPISTVPLQAVVLEDPLVLKSPRVSIPKLPQAVFKRNRWPQCTSFPSENVVHLKNWFIRKSRNGLFIDGIHREKNIPWNSNIITERVSKSVLKTVTGRVYVLDGKMDLSAPSQFPKCFLKSFVNGFPTKWREIYESYLSELKSVKRGSKTPSDKRKKSTAHMDQSPQQQNEKVETAKPCPSSNTPNIQVSRSGRLIKPPLDYWKGGRVILDAHMNVTIHDGYDSVIQPEATASDIAKSSVRTIPDKKAALEKVPVNDDCESSQQSQLKRRVKAQQRKPQKARNLIMKPPSPVKQSPPTRVTNLERQDTGKTREKAQKKTFKEQKGTKAVRGKVCKQLDSSLCSPPVASSGSQPPTHRREKKDTFKKNGAKSIDEKSLPRRSSRSSRSCSSTSSQEKETPAQKPQRHSNIGQKPRSKKSPPKPSQITKQTASRPNNARKKTTKNTHSSNPDDDMWTEEELRKLQEGVSCHPKYVTGYWTKVAMMVGTRSAEECHRQHSSQGASKTPTKHAKKAKQKAPAKEKADNPVISARMGTLRRKQQVRDFLEAMPKEDMDDVFSSEYMQNRRFEVPSMCPSDEQDFSVSDKEPTTPKPSGFLEAKTPQCQHITPGMMGSSSRNYDDKYVFQLQKRMKNHYQFNVQKHAPKNFSPTASVKKTMKRCGNTENDTFVVWEMFPDQEAQIDSGEEEDFYFSDND